MSAQEGARMPWRRRLVISLAVGMVVFGISCYAAYCAFAGSAVSYRPTLVLRDIARLARAVEAYRRERHALPKTLGDVSETSVRKDQEGRYLDWWRRPLQYRVEGDHYRIASFGWDGRPGGVGLDYDLSSDDLVTAALAQDVYQPLPRLSRPTFGQFVNHRGEMANAGSGRMMFLMCLLTGVVVAVLAFQEVDRAPPAGQGLWSRAIRVGFTVVGTLLVGAFITLIHTPSGH